MNDFTWRDEGTYICASASPNAVNNGPLSPCVPPVKKSSLATYPRLKRRAVDLLLANLVTVQFSLMQPCPTKPLIFCIADSGRAVQSTVFAVSVLPVMSYSVNDVCAVLELRYVCLCRSPGICTVSSLYRPSSDGLMHIVVYCTFLTSPEPENIN